MSRVFLLFVLAIMVADAQGQAMEELARRHALIDTLSQIEDHAGTIRAVERQRTGSVNTTWEDSLHLYIHKLGRAHWKLKNAEAGIAEAEGLYAWVIQRGAEPKERLEALSGLSWLYYELGYMKECLRVDSMALAIALDHPELGPKELAHAYQNVGFDHASMGHHQAAIRSYLQARSVYERSSDPSYLDLSECYNGAGVSSWHLGRTRAAEGYYREALAKLERSKDPDALLRKAGIVSNMGIMWQDAGDIPRSRANYQEGIRLSTEMIAQATDPTTRASAILSRSKGYVNLATVYFSLGDNGRSQELLDLAYRDRASVLEPSDPRLIGIRERMADIAIETRDLARAEVYITQFMEASSTYFGEGNEGQLRASTKLAEVYAGAGRIDEAAALFRRSIALQRDRQHTSTDPEFAVALRRRARFALLHGSTDEAITDLLEARTIMQRVHGEQHFKVAQYEVLLAEAAMAKADPTAALKWSSAALDKLQDRVSTLKQTSVPVAFPQPHLLPDAILWKVKAELALAATGGTGGDPSADIDLAIRSLDLDRIAIDDEGSQLGLVAAHKSLFDLAIDLAYVSYAQHRSVKDIDRFLGLMEADRSILLKARLNDFTSLRFSGVPDSVLLREQELIKAMVIDPEAEGPVTRAMDAENAFALFLNDLSKHYPRYYELRYGIATINVADVRKKLLRPGRDLLAYALTESYMYMLVVRTDTAVIVRTPNDRAAGTVHALSDAIAKRHVASYASTGFQAYSEFIAPIASLLTGKELLVIPDGPLHTVSFEAFLTDPSERNSSKNALIQRYAIAYLLSATTAVQFAEMARERSQGVLALAPGFSDREKQRYLAEVLDTGAVDRDFLNYVRQPFAVNTARGLARTLHATVLLESDANEAEFRERAEQFGILHLGTHAEMNATSPMYSRLVLSKSGSTTDAESDGYLHAYEIYELDLRAQLAVLSACETGTGRTDEGEGVRSLGYGFAYAGCPSLVVSLWSIDEKVSATILERFYAYLAEGMPKHIALRQAKLDHLAQAQDELALPYYWAGLVLVGDVGPVEIGGGWERVVGWCIAVLMLIGLFVWWFKRRRTT